MKRNQEFTPTCLDVFNFFFRSGFPSLIGDKATAVALAIIYKWNSLMRPAEFKMANGELETLSGSNSHIERTRQKIIDECKVRGVPLFTYMSSGTRRAGVYKINTRLVPDYHQINTRLTPDYRHNGNDLRERVEEETEVLGSKEKEKKKKKSLDDFSNLVYDRENPPEQMRALEYALNNIYDMSNLWCEEHFDCLQLLMENMKAKEILELGRRAKGIGVPANDALFWMAAQVKGEDYEWVAKT